MSSEPAEKRSPLDRASRIAGLQASAEYAAELAADPDMVSLLTRKRPPVPLTTKDQFSKSIPVPKETP